jgi:hypothetical protein
MGPHRCGGICYVPGERSKELRKTFGRNTVDCGRCTNCKDFDHRSSLVRKPRLEARPIAHLAARCFMPHTLAGTSLHRHHIVETLTSPTAALVWRDWRYKERSFGKRSGNSLVKSVA